MKRLFFILAAVMMTASVMVSCTKSQKTTEQEITFMGIPVSYPYDQFSAELSQKVQPEDVFEQEALYTGTFAGIDNCRIGVVQAEDGSIDLIAVDKTQGFETADIMNGPFISWRNCQNVKKHVCACVCQKKAVPLHPVF